MGWNDWLTLLNTLGTVVEIALVIWGVSRFGAVITRVLRKRTGRG